MFEIQQSKLMNIKRIIAEEILENIGTRIEEFLGPKFKEFLNCVRANAEVEGFATLNDCAEKHFVKLGEGNFKKVYEIDENFVLKVARRGEGANDIAFETNPKFQTEFAGVIPKVFYKDQNNRFAVIQKVKTFKSETQFYNTFKKIFEYPLFEKSMALYYGDDYRLLQKNENLLKRFKIDYLFKYYMFFRTHEKGKENESSNKALQMLDKIIRSSQILRNFFNIALHLNQYGVTLHDYAWNNIGIVSEPREKKNRLVFIDLLEVVR